MSDVQEPIYDASASEKIDLVIQQILLYMPDGKIEHYVRRDQVESAPPEATLVDNIGIDWAENVGGDTVPYIENDGVLQGFMHIPFTYVQMYMPR